MIRILAALTCLIAAAWTAEPLVKSGEKIVFMGDSITQQGAQSPSGYVRLVISGLEANGIAASAIPAGISGHKSDQMLARLKPELAKKPAWMTLSCGVNDVWHGAKGVPLDQYKSNITAILDQAKEAGVQVMILTATMIYEDPANAQNKSLAPYNEFLVALAKERKCPLADLNADMQAGLAAAGPEVRKRGNIYTGDGVHMNPVGNQMMALGVLRAFGLDEAQLAKAKEAWLDIPKAVTVSPKVAISFRQFGQLQELAAKQGRSLDKLVEELCEKAVNDAIAAPPAK